MGPWREGEVDASCVDMLGQGNGEAEPKGLVSPFGLSVVDGVRWKTSCFGVLGEKSWEGGLLGAMCRERCVRGAGPRTGRVRA